MTPAQGEGQQNLIRAGIARSRRNTHIELLIASGLLTGALVIGYLGLGGEQTGTSANVDSQDNIRASITAPVPEAALIDLPTSLSSATGILTATAESVIATLTPEFHFPGFIGPAFTDKTVSRLRYPELWSVCQEIAEDGGLPTKTLELRQALAEKLPAGGDIYLCVGAYGQSWRAVDAKGIPLWNQAQDTADPGTEAGDYYWTASPNDIPFDNSGWRMESLSKVYQLKQGERWQRLTVDGDGGVRVEAVLDANGRLVGWFDPRDGKFHPLEPVPATPTGTPRPGEATAGTIFASSTPGGVIPTGEAAATAVAPPPPIPPPGGGEIQPIPEGYPDIECPNRVWADLGYRWNCYSPTRVASIETAYPGMSVYVYEAVPGGVAKTIAGPISLAELDSMSLHGSSIDYDYGAWDSGGHNLSVMQWP